MKKISLLVLLAMLLVLVFTATACGDDCTHVDADDNGKCDNCGADFEDGDTPADDSCKDHKDANNDGICDTEGCGKVIDPDDSGDDECTDHVDNNGDGVCDNEGCEAPVDPTPAPGPGGDDECVHVDADDDTVCDECGDIYDDGHDVHYDADDDLVCDEPGCDEACDDGCDKHVDADDNGVCDNDGCEEACDDGCDNHVDKDDDGMCDNAGCTESCNDGCDKHVDKDDNGICDNAGCNESYTDGCDNHKDKDDNGVCDVDGCEEACDDGHDVHVDADENGICDEPSCEQVLDVTKMSVIDAINYAKDNASLVEFGTVTSSIVNSGYSTNLYGVFMLDDGYCFVMYNDGYSDYAEWYWVTNTGAWSVVACQHYGGESDGICDSCEASVDEITIVNNNYEYSADNTKGFYIDGSSTNWDVQASYGAELFLANLYNFATGSGAFAFQETSEDGAFSFTYAVIDYAGNLGVATVNFALAEEGYLTLLQQTFVQYEPANVTITYQTDGNGDFVLDSDGNQIPVGYEITAGAANIKDYAIVIAQLDDMDKAVTDDGSAAAVEEIRALAAEGDAYAADKILVSDFELLYNGTKVDANNPIDVKKGETYIFEIANIYPATADPSFDALKLYDENGNMFWAWDVVFKTYQEDGKWYASMKVAKTFAPGTVNYWTISGAAFSYDIAVRTPTADVTSFVPSIILPDNTTTSNTTVNITLDQVIVIGATVNTGAVNTFVAALGGEYENVLLEQISDTACEFSASVAGTYVITITSTENADFSATVTVNVTEKAPVPDVDISGTYVMTDAFGNNATVVIDDVNFTVSFTYIKNMALETATVNYTYEFVDGELTVYNGDVALDAAMMDVTIDQTTGLVAGAVINGTSYTYSAGAEEGETLADGEYVGTNADSGDSITLTVSGNSITYYYLNEITLVVITDTFDYTLTDGVVALTLDGSAVDASFATLTVVDGAITECTYKGVTYTFAASEGGDEEQSNEDILVGKNFASDTYSATFFYDSESGNYYMNVWANDGTFDAYYIYTVTSVDATYGDLYLNVTFDPDYWMSSLSEDPLAITSVAVLKFDSYLININESTVEIPEEVEVVVEPTDEDILVGKNFASDTYSATFFYDSESGNYYMNVWANDGTFDAYYTYTVTSVDATYGDLYLNVTFDPDYWMSSLSEDPLAITSVAVLKLDNYLININESTVEIPEEVAGSGEEGGSEPTYTTLFEGVNTIQGVSTVLSYYAEADGTLIIELGNAIMDENLVATYAVNYGDAIALVANTPVELALAAGDIVVVTVTTTGGYVDVYATWEAAPSEDTGNTVLVMGNNDINAADVTFEYTALADGTLTLAINAWIMNAGSASYSLNDGVAVDIVTGTPAEIVLSAGDVVVITVTANSDYATLVASWTEAEVDDGSVDLTIGNNNISAEDVVYSYTAAADGTLTLNYPAFAMAGENASITYSINGADAVAVEAGVDAVLELVVGDKVIITVVADGGYATLNAAWAEAVADDGSVSLTLGNNDINAADVIYSYTADANGTLNLNISAWIMNQGVAVYSVNGGEAVALVAGTAVDVELAAGDKVLVTVTANGDYGTLVAAWTATGSGTESDPYNLKELPSEITFYSDATNKVYYTFVAAESGTITFTYPTADSWCDIFEMDGTNTTANSTSSSSSETMVFDIEAGKTYRFSLGTWTNVGDVTVTIAVAPATEEGGEDGGDVVVAGPDGTWIGAVNGRGMKVVIDTAAGTMIVTRAASSSTTNFDGQTSYTYTYSLVDGVVTYTGDGSWSPITSMTFDENGCPLTVVWNGATYTDFVLQA